MDSLSLCDWSLKGTGWSISTLWFMPAQAWYSVWLSWDDDGKHLGWYVNFQEPFRRTKVGFQTMDLMLDIVVQPDRTWEMKDEDEFSELLARSLISQETAERVEEAVATVLSAIQRGAVPFNEEWVKWRPDPSWPTPRLLAGWEEVTTA